MAVDTAERRFSMMDFCGSATGIINIVPDGILGAGNRMHLLGLYSGTLDADEAGGDAAYGYLRAITSMNRMLNR